MLLIFGRNRMVAVTGIVLVLIVVAIVLSHVRAVKPAGGAVYRGTADVESSRGRVLARFPLSFAIDATGTRARDFGFSAGLPSTCLGVDTGRLGGGSAPITRPERVVARLPILTSAGRVGTATIAGNFEAAGRAIGALTTRFSVVALRHCDAAATFTARS